MLSKNQIKLIQKLSQKKYRNQYGLFVVEGKKSIQEFINSGYELHSCYTLDKQNSIDSVQISVEDLNKISFLKHPDDGLAVFYKKQIDLPESDIIVALDNIRDPGNLGTIIRLCDWFGVSDLICSEQTVDCYNPKVVQSTMGSLSRVRVRYESLERYLLNTDRAILAAVIDGENVYRKKLPKRAVLVMGNESNGICEKIQSMVEEKITIPRFGTLQKTESLNVATSVAILLSELMR